MAWWRSLLASATPPAGARPAHGALLTPTDRAKLEYLRLNTGAFLALTRDGARIGPRPGGMVEFHGHQNYTPGMDIRGLDWSAYARNRQWMVRQYAREAAAHIHVFVDASASMAFDLVSRDGPHDRPTTKFREAARLAAMIACIALGGQDRLSLYLARAPEDRAELTSLRGLSGLSQLPAVLRFLEGVEPAGRIADRDMILSILSTQPERGLLVWITDALDVSLLAPAAARPDGSTAGASGAATQSNLEQCLAWATQAIGRVWLIQVQAEQDWWAGGGRLELVDAETGDLHALNVNASAKEHFRSAAHEHSQQIAQAVARYGGTCLTIRDHEDPFERLYRCLQGG